MNYDINLKPITKENLDLASKIQNEIFPGEDGTLNFIECINQDPYRKELDYSIAFDGDIPIGVTGFYSYNEYPDDAWLGWFGVLSKYRNKGYGSIIFDKTVKLVKDKGYKNFRVYTDEGFQDAIKFYTKKGMISEVYDNPDDIDPYLPEGIKTLIFSLNLTDKKIDCWNNKILGLKEQGIKEHQ